MAEKEEEVQRLMARYGKHAGIDYSKPSCTNCHRRERHNRVNCPYKAHPCQSAEFCGNLSKHKDLKKLESHFKGKIPPVGVSLLKALTEYDKKIVLESYQVPHQGNPVRTLWELKGIKWPS